MPDDFIKEVEMGGRHEQRNSKLQERVRCLDSLCGIAKQPIGVVIYVKKGHTLFCVSVQPSAITDRRPLLFYY